MTGLMPASVRVACAPRGLLVCAALVMVLAPAASIVARAEQAQAAGATVGVVRIHGNHTTPDEEVLRLAGIAEGTALPPGGAADVAARLEASRRFRRVEVRLRQRSIADPSDVALIVIVEEHAVPAAGPVPAPARWLRTTGAGLMWLPILDYEHAYGLTYGARVSLVDALGPRSRLSVPLTWGGTRRAALEIERRVAPLREATLLGGVAIWQREHPYWDVDERRTGVWGGAVLPLGAGWRAEPRVTWASVRFGGDSIDLTTIGADVVLDTRLNPSLPRDAVYLRGGVQAVREQGRATYRRTHADLRGYLGLIGTSVIAVRARVEDASAPQPAYLQPWLGGSASLRGMTPGRLAGDRLLAASAELRVPFSSPLNVGTAGLALFTDVGAVGAHGVAFREFSFERSVGAGLFLALPVFSVNLDVARVLGGGTRLHVATGVRF